MEQLTDGLWRWTTRHPEWHPGEFGAEVACFAAQAGDTTLLIDPLLPPEPAEVLDTIDGALGERLAILITIPYHVRSSEELWRRYRRDAETTIHGHRAAAKRLEDRSAFREIEPGVPLPGGVTAYTIGKPRRYEMPLHLPSHGALAFGDAVWRSTASSGCGPRTRSTPRSSASTESASTRPWSRSWSSTSMLSFPRTGCRSSPTASRR